MQRQLILAAVVSLCLCGSALAAAPASQPSAARPTSEQLALAHRLEAAINAGDEPAAESTFDHDAFFQRVVAGLKLSPDEWRREREREGTGEFGYVPAVKRVGNQFHVLRVRMMGGEWRALLRTVGPDGGFNYSEYVMARDAKQRWRFVDLYKVALGLMQSEVERHSALLRMACDRGNSAGLSQWERDELAHPRALSEMQGDIEAGKYAEAIAVYAALPASLREDRLFLYVRLTAAEKMLPGDRAPYGAAAADFRRLFPGDLAADMMDMQWLMREHDYSGLRELFEKLQNYTGGDPYICWLEGHYDMAEGGARNLAAARELFREAIDAKPTLRQPYFDLLRLSLETKDFELTAATLDEMGQKAGIPFPDVEHANIFSEFVKSAAYRNWRARQSGGSAATRPG